MDSVSDFAPMEPTQILDHAPSALEDVEPVPMPRTVPPVPLDSSTRPHASTQPLLVEPVTTETSLQSNASPATQPVLTVPETPPTNVNLVLMDTSLLTTVLALSDATQDIT
jgi:hypothetical protein